MSSRSSKQSSTKKVSILYESPRTSNDSLASRSSSEYSAGYSYDMATTASTRGSNSSRYNGYSGSALSSSSRSSRDAVDTTLIRTSNPTTGKLIKCYTTPATSSLTRSSTATPHGYYAKERINSAGKKVTVHNTGMRSERDEPRTTSYKKR